MLLREMVFDERYPNMRVDPDWFEGKHPQEFLPKVEDPIALYRPAVEVILGPTAPILTVTLVAEQASLTWSPSETDISEILSYTIVRSVDGDPFEVLIVCNVLRDFLGGIIGVENCTTVPSIPHNDSGDSGSVYDKVTNEDAPVTYVDTTLSSGHTYCYAVFSTPMGNNQSVAQGPPSANSNIVCVTVTTSGWVLRTTPFTGDITSVFWNGTIFVAVSDVAEIATSPDGITWTLRDSPLQGIPASTNFELAPGFGSTGPFATLPNNTYQPGYGSNVVPSGFSTGSITPDPLLIKSQRLIVLGEISASGPVLITLAMEAVVPQNFFNSITFATYNLTSSTATFGGPWTDAGLSIWTWPKVADLGSGPYAGTIFYDDAVSADSVTYGNGKWVVVGHGATNIYITTSTDGTTWTSAIQLPNNGAATTSYTIAYGNGTFVVTTGNLPTDPPGANVYTSADAVTWTVQPSTPGFIFSDVIFDGSRFIAGLQDPVTNIATSPDGATWTTHNTAFSNGGFIGSLAFNHATVGPLAGLYSGADFNVALTSSSFTYIPSTTLNTGMVQPDSVQFDGSNNGVLIVIGYVADDTNLHAAVSSDGVAWALEDTLFESKFANGLAYGAGRFVAFGQTGTLSTRG